ncbi:MAG TPA: aminotransferase class IV [Nitriliruptorales bacterium]|nr:aminotransferase class IV [Nitriliruptorales bacterium]
MAPPRPIAWVDGRVVPATEATVPLLDDGFLRGDAVFDAILVRRGRTHALEPISYAANAWATRQARAQHADDALIVQDDGTVLELPTAAIVWVEDGALRAPDPGRLPILDSVTVAELRTVVDVQLGVHPLDQLLAASEVFVVSATRPVIPVHAIGDVEYPAPGAVTASVREAFLAHVDANLDPMP